MIPTSYHQSLGRYLEWLSKKTQILVATDSKIILQQQSLYANVFHSKFSDGIHAIEQTPLKDDAMELMK